MVRNPTKIALETLQNLVSNSAPPRGTPFPKVPGPKKDDKVLSRTQGSLGDSKTDLSQKLNMHYLTLC